MKWSTGEDAAPPALKQKTETTDEPCNLQCKSIQANGTAVTKVAGTQDVDRDTKADAGQETAPPADAQQPADANSKPEMSKAAATSNATDATGTPAAATDAPTTDQPAGDHMPAADKPAAEGAPATDTTTASKPATGDALATDAPAAAAAGKAATDNASTKNAPAATVPAADTIAADKAKEEEQTDEEYYVNNTCKPAVRDFLCKVKKMSKQDADAYMAEHLTIHCEWINLECAGDPGTVRTLRIDATFKNAVDVNGKQTGAELTAHYSCVCCSYCMHASRQCTFHHCCPHVAEATVT